MVFIRYLKSFIFRFKKNSVFLYESLVDHLMHPYLIAAIFMYFICLLEKNELLVYIYSLVCIIYISFNSISKKKKILWNLLLLSPTAFKVNIIFLFFMLKFIMGGYNKRFDKIFVDKMGYKKSGGLLYAKYVLFITSFFIMLLCFLYTIPYFMYFPFEKGEFFVYILFVGTITLTISTFIFSVLFTSSFELIRFAFKKQHEEDSYGVIFSYFIIIIVFLALPDALYSALYSLILNVFLSNSYSVYSINYYSFMLHFLIPMNSYYLGIQNAIQSNFVLSGINIIHSYTIKIIDSVIVSAIVVSLLVNRIQIIFTDKATKPD